MHRHIARRGHPAGRPRGTATALALGLALCLAIALGGLAGCGEQPDPKPVADPTPTPSATTPTPTAPALPTAATKHTKAGALAFAKHYIALINYAQATGDTDEMRNAGGRRCRSCRQLRQTVETIYSSGGTIDGGAWRVRKVLGVIPNADTDGFNVEAVIRFGPQVIRRGGGKVQQLKGGTGAITVFVSPQKRGWEVDECTRAS